MPGIGLMGGRFGGTATAPSITIGIFSDAGHTTPITETDYTDNVYLLASAPFTATNFTWYIDDGVEEYSLTGESVTFNTTDVQNDVTITCVANDGTTFASGQSSTLTINNNPTDIYDEFDAVALVSNPDIKLAWVECIRDINRDSNWNKLECVFPIIGGTSTSHAVDLLYPNDPTKVVTWVGSPTHNAKGAYMNGSSIYGQTWYRGGTEGLNKNSCGLAYVNGAANISNAIVMGARSNGNDFYMRRVGVSRIGGNNSGVVMSAALDTGFSLVSRISANIIFGYVNSEMFVGGTSTNTYTSWVNNYVCLSRSANGSGGASLCQFAAVHAGLDEGEALGLIQAVNKCNGKIR